MYYGHSLLSCFFSFLFFLYGVVEKSGELAFGYRHDFVIYIPSLYHLKGRLMVMTMISLVYILPIS